MRKRIVANASERYDVAADASGRHLRTSVWRQRMAGVVFLLCPVFLSPAWAQTKFIQAVDEYVPAPGQFVNLLPPYVEGDTPATMAQKCTDSIGGGNSRPDLPMGRTRSVTLGAYGGFITFHFDHPIPNISGRRDFAVWGNAFANNAEPAVVMVAADVNGNGLPDDTFYELKGSEYDNPQTVHHYSLTYTYRPMGDTPWTDNQGATGFIARNDYHKQEYFPQWLAGQGTLTFSGTLLPKNATFMGGMFLLKAYAYGYADNQPNLDDSDAPNSEGCGFDISWAVDDNGHPVTLDRIDFVKVCNAMNQICGWIGETSTEITGAEDLHLEASLEWVEEQAKIATSCMDAVPARPTPGAAASHDLSGRPTASSAKGLRISKGKKHFVK